MLATLNVPYIDTSAADLAWTLDHPVVPALTMTVVDLPHARVRLELRVLGASHQVVLRDCPAGQAGEPDIVETVACLSGHESYLPGSLERRIGARGYRFHARVEHVAAADISARVAALRHSSDDGDMHTVVASFPSDPDAVTALRSEPGTAGIAWKTWHVYPKSGQIVTTGTALRL